MQIFIHEAHSAASHLGYPNVECGWPCWNDCEVSRLHSGKRRGRFQHWGVTFRFAAAVNADERRANASVRTGNVQSMRLEPHRMAQLLGSKSKIMTLSPASWAATARQVASVVLPHPPLCVANTMVRIEKILSINEMFKNDSFD
jgi:hypothetical protein